jgi:Ca2+-binding EF-hand superfamily protein
MKYDFNLIDAFGIFDPTGRGYITRMEYINTLNLIGIYPTSKEMELLMTKYDIDRDGLIKYSEFVEIVAPKDKSFYHLLIERMPFNTDRRYLRT